VAAVVLVRLAPTADRAQPALAVLEETVLFRISQALQ
jgi:hypothetical protein